MQISTHALAGLLLHGPAPWGGSRGWLTAGTDPGLHRAWWLLWETWPRST